MPSGDVAATVELLPANAQNTAPFQATEDQSAVAKALAVQVNPSDETNEPLVLETATKTEPFQATGAEPNGPVDADFVQVMPSVDL